MRLQPLKLALAWQLVACVLMMVLADWLWGKHSAVSAGYGSVIVIINTLLMVWHIWRAAMTAKADAKKNLSRAYRCVAERWLSTTVMFVIGIFFAEIKRSGVDGRFYSDAADVI